MTRRWRNKFERIDVEGRWTSRSPLEVFVQVDWLEGYSVSRVDLARWRRMPRWVADLLGVATYAGTEGWVDQDDVLWVARPRREDQGLGDPTWICAAVAQAPDAGVPWLRPTWVAQPFDHVLWDARLVAAVQAHHGVDTVRRDRHPSSYIPPTRSTT